MRSGPAEDGFESTGSASMFEFDGAGQSREKDVSLLTLPIAAARLLKNRRSHQDGGDRVRFAQCPARVEDRVPVALEKVQNRPRYDSL